MDTGVYFVMLQTERAFGDIFLYMDFSFWALCSSHLSVVQTQAFENACFTAGSAATCLLKYSKLILGVIQEELLVDSRRFVTKPSFRRL